MNDENHHLSVAEKERLFAEYEDEFLQYENPLLDACNLPHNSNIVSSDSSTSSSAYHQSSSNPAHIQSHPPLGINNSSLGESGGGGRLVTSPLAFLLEGSNGNSNTSNNNNNEWKSLQLFCNQSSDGILCWPKTSAGEIAQLPCSFQLHGVRYDTSGSATRICDVNGSWLRSDYADCIPLITPQGTEGTDDTLLFINTTVYQIGYALSLCFLVLAILIFLSFKELYCLRNKIHTQLMLTYICADTLWIITSFTGSQASPGGAGHVSCVTFILLHYFHITNFFWMLVEGLYLYILVVQTFIADNIKLRTYALIGWGIPFMILFAWAFAKWLTQVEVDQNLLNDPEFATLPTCPWLNISVYDWIYKAPVIFVLAANMAFLFQIMWVLITKLRSAMNPETQQSRKAAKALLVLMPLLGITYVLILTGSKQTPIYEYIRALLISTQGLLVALLYCFCNGEVRSSLRHRWNNVKDGCRSFSCCGCEFEGLENVQQMRDLSPRSRTESIRLYTPNVHNFRKRESSGVSDITTMSTIRGSSLNGSPNVIHTLTVFNNKKSSPRLSTTSTTTSTIPIHTVNNCSANSPEKMNLLSSNDGSTMV